MKYKIDRKNKEIEFQDKRVYKDSKHHSMNIRVPYDLIWEIVRKISRSHRD